MDNKWNFGKFLEKKIKMFPDIFKNGLIFKAGSVDLEVHFGI